MKRSMITFLFGLMVSLVLGGCDTEAADLSATANLPTLQDGTPAGVNPTNTASNQPNQITQPTGVVTEAHAEEVVVAAIQPVTFIGQLSDAEIAGLYFMREEEKLAHDVYLALYDIWNLPILKNIATSELNHVESVLRVLAQYGLSDPAVGNPAGVFNDPALQTLYAETVAQGSQSLLDALYVGTAIEEVDILDLQARLAQMPNPDIVRVYESLLSGSANHLGSFARLIEQQTGATYAPQYLTDAAYAEIMALAEGNGRNGQGAGDQGGQGQSQGNSGQGQGNRGQGRGGQS